MSPGLENLIDFTSHKFPINYFIITPYKGTNRDPALTNMILQAYGLGVTFGAILPFSRSQESEADRIGLVYMARAGYDSREAIGFWERMEEANMGRPRPHEYLSTHPGYGTRIDNINRWLPDAIRIYNVSRKAPNNLISVNLSNFD